MTQQTQPPKLKWKQGQFTVLLFDPGETKGKPTTKSGIVSADGCFGIYKTELGEYSITHLPSGGYLIRGFNKQITCKRFCDALSEGLNWKDVRYGTLRPIYHHRFKDCRNRPEFRDK